MKSEMINRTRKRARCMISSARSARQDLIPVSDLDADEFIQTLHRDDIAATGHVLTSAKTGEGIQEAFEMGLDAVHAKKRGAQQGDNDDAKSDTSSIGSDENCVIL